jgi:hypothetical protein
MFRSDTPTPAISTLLSRLFEGMLLRALEDRASEDSGPLDFDYESLGCQLCIFLGPRPTHEDLHRVLFSLTNITAQLWGEPLSLEYACRLAVVPFGSSPQTASLQG